MHPVEVKPAWRGAPAGIFTLTLGFVLASSAARAAAMFGPPGWRVLFMLMCIAMMALPWLVLSREGRRQIGLQWPRHAGWIPLGLLLGGCAASACYLIGAALYGAGIGHPFVSVARNYLLQEPDGWSLLRLHLTFTVAACLFSPLGEEIFYRGFLQKVLADRYGATPATAMEAGLFALVHLCHHGILVTAAGVVLLPASGALWVGQMFLLALLFAWLRRGAASLLPAIAAHAAFNAAMNAWIFARLWP